MHPHAHPDHSAWLHQALREQGEDEATIATLEPIFTRLAGAEPLAVHPDTTARLIDTLTTYLPASPIRRAIQEHVRRDRGGWRIIAIARTQTRILTPAFWLSNLAILLIGIVSVVLAPPSLHSFALRLLSPLAAVGAVNSAFRGQQLGVWDCERTCPLDPFHLTLARLLLIVGFDLGAGVLFVGGWLALGLGTGFWTLLAIWLAPLFLVIGVALLLSMRWPTAVACSGSYLLWLVLVIGMGGTPHSLDLPLVLTSQDGAATLLGVVMLSLGVAVQSRQSGWAER